MRVAREVTSSSKALARPAIQKGYGSRNDYKAKTGQVGKAAASHFAGEETGQFLDAGDVRFVVADEARWQQGEDGILVAVPLAAVEELAGLFTGKVRSGGLAILPGLRFVVVS